MEASHIFIFQEIYLCYHKSYKSTKGEWNTTVWRKTIIKLIWYTKSDLKNSTPNADQDGGMETSLNIRGVDEHKPSGNNRVDTHHSVHASTPEWMQAWMNGLKHGDYKTMKKIKWRVSSC